MIVRQNKEIVRFQEDSSLGRTELNANTKKAKRKKMAFLKNSTIKKR